MSSQDLAFRGVQVRLEALGVVAHGQPAERAGHRLGVDGLVAGVDVENQFRPKSYRQFFRIVDK
jgi:hypothetical protein